MKTKPAMTQKFEEDDKILTCDEAAVAMLNGAESGNHHIAATFLGKVFYNSARGATPLANPILGPFYDCVSWVRSSRHLILIHQLIVHRLECHSGVGTVTLKLSSTRKNTGSIWRSRASFLLLWRKGNRADFHYFCLYGFFVLCTHPTLISTASYQNSPRDCGMNLHKLLHSRIRIV